MLYPIELLRHCAERHQEPAARQTASMLTTRPAFVMSSVAFLPVGNVHKEGTFRDCGATALPQGLAATVHFAILPNCHLADCNLPVLPKPCKLLKLLGFILHQELARRLLYSLA